METFKDVLIFIIGAPLVFGLISSVINGIEDWFARSKGTVVGRPTGKIIQIGNNEELVEFEKANEPGETVVRRRGRG